ncbi:type I toxin-antitoxin system Fst family toxin [Xylocopilactobacillus apis]|nr:type I toxin-antitoxin system Fst family toxin [Xylocopilactobacillus apis]
MLLRYFIAPLTVGILLAAFNYWLNNRKKK